jgi:REP element-mobilizing transposase RayT
MQSGVQRTVKRSSQKKSVLHYFPTLKANARDKGIYLDFINGYSDHVHILFTLNADLSLSKTMQLIKGESSYWANNNRTLKTKIEWADDYFAVSVSESMVSKVRNYIRNQEEHHKKLSFKEEYDQFMEKYGFGVQG